MADCFDRVERRVKDNLEKRLHCQMLAGEFCDINLCIGSVTYKVHSCVLASFSLYFNNLIKCLQNTGQCELSTSVFINNVNPNETLYEKWSFRNPLKISLTDIFQESSQCSSCTSSVLDFIYLGKLHIQREHRKHVQKLGEVLQIPEISKICEEFNSEANNEVICKINSVSTSEEAYTKEYAEVKINKISDFNLVYETDCIESGNNNLNSVIPVPERKHLNKISEEKFEKSSVAQTNSIHCDKSDKLHLAPFVCSVCSHKFPSQKLLEEHHYYHVGRLYRCYTCKFYSHKAHDLYQHLTSANHEETVCSFCMFEGKTAGILKSHIENHSHPEKPFVCSECNNRYATRARLKEHFSKHSNVDKFVCAICTKSFKRKSGLQSHINVHLVKKKYLCSYCGFSAAHRASLRRHQLKHKGVNLKCHWEGCTYETSDKSHLQAHIRVHSKQKEYQCEICGHSFSHLRNLRRHATRHVNGNCFEYCPLCNFKSERMDKLIWHFKRCHPTEDLKSLRTRSKIMKLGKNNTIPDFNGSTEKSNNRVQEKRNTLNVVQELCTSPNVQKNALSTYVSVESQNMTKNLIIFTGAASSNSGTNTAVVNVRSSNKITLQTLSNNSSSAHRQVYSHPLLLQKFNCEPGNIENGSRQQTSSDIFSNQKKLKNSIKHNNSLQTLLQLSESVVGELNKSLPKSKEKYNRNPVLNHTDTSNKNMPDKCPINSYVTNNEVFTSTTDGNPQELVLNSPDLKTFNKNSTDLNIHVSQTPANILEAQIINYDSLLESLESTQLDLPTLDDNVTILSAVNDLHGELDTPVSFIANTADGPFRKLVQNNYNSCQSSDFTNLKIVSNSEVIEENKRISEISNSDSDPQRANISVVKNQVNLNSNSSDALSLNIDCLCAEPQQNIQLHEESSFDTSQPLFQSLETFLDFDDL